MRRIQALRKLMVSRHEADAVPTASDGGQLPSSRTSSTPKYAAKNPRFKKVYDIVGSIPRDEMLWCRVAEHTFESFMARMSAANKLG